MARWPYPGHWPRCQAPAVVQVGTGDARAALAQESRQSSAGSNSKTLKVRKDLEWQQIEPRLQDKGKVG